MQSSRHLEPMTLSKKFREGKELPTKKVTPRAKSTILQELDADIQIPYWDQEPADAPVAD